MSLTIITEILGVLLGGGIGALFMQLYTARANKKKLEAEAAGQMADADQKKLDTKQDAFDTMYEQLNKCMADYSAISEEYRQYREKARKTEDDIYRQIQDKRTELAAMKAQITYLQGIRCYNFSCPNRIKADPFHDDGETLPADPEEE